MIVMKFGGTSVQDEPALSRCMQAIVSHLRHRPVVVLSAMGKTTNKLLQVAEDAAGGNLDSAVALSNELRAHHLGVVRNLTEGALLQEAEDRLEAFFDEIANIIRGLYLLGECTPRTKDAIASFGERMSTLILAQAMRQKGHHVALLDSREMIRTDDRFTEAVVLQDASFPLIREKVIPALEAGKVAILQGFIGSTVAGVTTTIGRGGSDYTAALVGAALDARDIQIWTNVPGILTADPLIVPQVYKIKAISFAEASELAYFGAKVLHPSTLLPAVSRNIPVHVCSSSQITQPGTVICAESIPTRNPVKSIACKRGITVVNVHSARMLLAHGFLRRIFEIFERHHTVVDVVATSEVNVSLTIDSSENLDAILPELRALGEVDVEPNMAIICVVGDNLKYTAGVAAKLFSAVETINVGMISLGASRINVTFLVEEGRMEEAVRHLHDQFFQAPDPEIFELCQP
jgi:aspartate kinase